jgi:prolyl-tRNA editing enzyme YbaK/EbsC (Cys-tRNA(Pro) deacylase)
VFIADTTPVLVLTSGGNRVDVVKVGKETGSAGVRKADAEEVRAATGYAIGGTPPFGHARELQVLVDRHLTGFDVVWAAAGTPRHVFPITPADLVRVTGGRVADIALDET